MTEKLGFRKLKVFASSGLILKGMPFGDFYDERVDVEME